MAAGVMEGETAPAERAPAAGGVTLRRVVDASDPDLAAVAELLATTFADPDVVLPLERLRQFVAEPATSESDREFHVVIAAPSGRVVGTVVFSYVPAVNCGFSEYIAVAREARGAGVARRLFQKRRALLDEAAQRAGHAACAGLFVEVENPQRTPAEVVESERETALDVEDRWRFFHHFGFRRVDVAYVQPPLAAGKHAVDYLDLLFLAWDQAAARDAAVPAAWVRGVVLPIWRRWTPETCAEHYRELCRRLGNAPVALRPLF